MSTPHAGEASQPNVDKLSPPQVGKVSQPHAGNATQAHAGEASPPHDGRASAPHVRNVGVALGALLASSTTLVCCVLPAVFVSLGAGAALVGLVSAVPQLVWLSEHKATVFTTAAVLLLVSGVLLWRARSLPCPADPLLARSCVRLRRASYVLYSVSSALFLVGAGFSWVANT